MVDATQAVASSAVVALPPGCPAPGDRSREGAVWVMSELFRRVKVFAVSRCGGCWGARVEGQMGGTV